MTSVNIDLITTKKRVGDVISDETGGRWVVAKVWEHHNHYDYGLYNQNTGEQGSLRTYKTEINPKKP